MNLPPPLDKIVTTMLREVDPRKLMVDFLQTSSLAHENRSGRLIVVGAGKAAVPMALGCEDVLGQHIDDGLVITKYGNGLRDGETLNIIAVEEAGHPIVDEAGLGASKRILVMIDHLSSNDTVLFLLSGGASALFEQLPEYLSLADYQKCIDEELLKGTDILALNEIRKNHSLVKGGKLVRRILPARFLTLVLSDVVGDDLSAIGSGPTYLEAHRAQHVVLANNDSALSAAAKKVQAMGYQVFLKNNVLGDASEVAESFVNALRAHDTKDEPCCVLWGGETTVQVTGNGLGGRNQHFVLSCLQPLSSLSRSWLMMSLGSDGNDGPTEAAGAFLSPAVYQAVQEKMLNARDYLTRCDAYHFFEQSGGLIHTGRTRTNVMDIMVALTI